MYAGICGQWLHMAGLPSISIRLQFRLRVITVYTMLASVVHCYCGAVEQLMLEVYYYHSQHLPVMTWQGKLTMNHLSAVVQHTTLTDNIIQVDHFKCHF